MGEGLVRALAQGSSLEAALQVHHTLPRRTVVSWTAVIAGYTKAGQGHEALQTYQTMLEEGVQPNKYTLSSLLKACGIVGDLKEGKRIHAEAIKYKCEYYLVVGTCLVDMYAKCGSIEDARIVFDGLPWRDVVSWTAMLAGYAQQELGDEALNFYEELLLEGVTPNDQTFVSVLQACSKLSEAEEHFSDDGYKLRIKSLHRGRAIHAYACMTGYSANVFVANALISMYAKCGSLLDAWNWFRGLPHWDVVSWNTMLAGYAQQELADEVLTLYSKMIEEGISPNARTFVSTLQACAMLGVREEGLSVKGLVTKVDSLNRGKELHADAWKRGHKLDSFVCSTLVNMYAKCGSIEDAENVYYESSMWDAVTVTAMMMAYALQDQPEKALELYGQMKEECVNPVDRTFVIGLQACGMLADKEEDVIVQGRAVKLESLQKGKSLHAEVRKMGYESDVFVGNILVSMYGKCGSTLDARTVFDSLSHQDVVSWNALLAAYVQHGLMEKALQLYGQMQGEGVNPNEITFLHILEGCSSTGSLGLCIQTHSDIVSTLQELSPLVACTLIYAYGRCGSMTKAQIVFDGLPTASVVSWNALIAGYARQGDCEALMACYQEMQLTGVEPNGVTFLSLIYACSHAGMVGKGVEYFESMSRDYGITPDTQHYVCMVDLFGRAGYFTVVEDLLLKMPLQPNLSMWLCLLGACQKHGNVLLGKYAFDRALRLEPMVTSPYMLMSNIFLDARMWASAKKVNDLRQQAGAWKKPGQSWIEHEREVHRFEVGYQDEHVYGLVRKLSRELTAAGCYRHVQHVELIST